MSSWQTRPVMLKTSSIYPHEIYFETNTCRTYWQQLVDSFLYNIDREKDGLEGIKYLKSEERLILLLKYRKRMGRQIEILFPDGRSQLVDQSCLDIPEGVIIE